MKSGHNYYIYIVECKDGSYYTGITNNLDRSLWEHNSGYNESCYTFNKRPVKLRYCEHFTNALSAIAFEKQIKGWSRKKKKHSLKMTGKKLAGLLNPRRAKKIKTNLRQAQGDSLIVVISFLNLSPCWFFLLTNSTNKSM